MQEQKIHLIYFKYIIKAPRELKDNPLWKNAYANSTGTNIIWRKLEVTARGDSK